MGKITEFDLVYLKRCVELAEEACNAGDEPFGSILVNQEGKIIAEALNRVNEKNVFAHPEFELAEWALAHLSLTERKNTAMYTSGEHCPMCATAHGWAQLGKIVYLSSAQQLQTWLQELNAPESPINFIPIEKLIKNIVVKGPAQGALLSKIKNLHRKYQLGKQ